METNIKVIEILKKNKKPMKAGEIAETSGIDKKEVVKAIKKLVAEGKVNSPECCKYSIK